ncbi:glycosyltransferase family 4 protein [Kocuria sp.]|uniref:glycosyltransferase family 4 protein n=1 Tax=Kocuria sp. TaxID=1871328 RepID=UPI0026DFDFB2|nr:glycosyltransferase family 4 protein [Kocuria sp.]MDO5619719.1 glycosyltransferase family 4 protein [Kocuria sp.]
MGELAGVGRHVLDVATAGLPGLRLLVLCPEGPLAHALRDVGVGVIVAPFGPEAGLHQSIRQLRSVVHTLRPAVVHTHLAYADLVAAVAFAADRRVKLISTEHGIAQDDLVYHGSASRSWARARLHSLRLRRFDALIAVSESTRETMEHKWRPSQPIHVIRNAVNVDGLTSVAQHRLATRNPAGPRILSLARLAPEKRIDALLHAVPFIVQQCPAATVTIAGTGPDLAVLQRLTTHLAIQDVVHFVGFVDSREALAENDVVVQLSTWENLSYTLLDAQVSGMEAVATNVGGNAEILPPDSLISDLSPQAVAAAVLGAWERAQDGHSARGGHTKQDRRPFDDGGVAYMTEQISSVALALLPSSNTFQEAGA